MTLINSTAVRAAQVGIVAALAAGSIVGPAAATDTDRRSTGAPTDSAKDRADRARGVEIFAHRGASGYRPEHTLAAYKLAIELGADYIEPDLVSTKDGVLVARHENVITGTTDVEERPEFAERKTSKTIDGLEVTGWFTEDFTLKELKTLRAKERLPDVRPGNTLYDGRFEIPTFDEVLALAKSESRGKGRAIGVAPETKHPTYFASIGLDLEDPLLRSLRRAGLDRPSSKVVIQSFETGNLRDLSRRTKVPLVQLTSASGAPYDLIATGDSRTYADLMAPKGLKDIARYADWVGPEKNAVIPRNADGSLGEPNAVVRDAHREGLRVVVYTFRDENQFLPTDYRIGDNPNAKGDIAGELRVFLDTGIDAVFADYPDTAAAAMTLTN